MGRKKSQSNTFRIELSSQYQEKSKEELLDELIDSKIEIERLKNKLRRYENPHTPSSKDERKTKTNFVSLTGLAVGKKTGYKGATRENKKPTNFVDSFDNVCSQCNKHNNPQEIKTKIYEDIPDPQPTKIVKVKWGVYTCVCGHSWESKPIEVPDKGIFGKNLLAQITLLRFDDRLPLRKTISAIERQYKTTLTSKVVYDITKRVADKATPAYNTIKMKIRKAKHLNIDETKIKVQGVWYYLWIFRSEKYVFFVIRRERNRNVLDEILGYHYRGSNTCDGLSAYEEYTKYLQRCWAHILRETKDYADKYDDAKPMHEWMKDLFEKVCSVTVKTSIKKREAIYRKCNKEMEHLTQIYSSYCHLGEIITKIKNGLPYWFTRILHPRIHPTNNNAERPLREPVVFKKIIGTLRNEDGAKIFSVIMTLLATWKLQDKNKFTELRALL